MLRKQMLNKLLFCALVLAPFDLLANWSTFDTPELTDKSKAISTQVNALPEQHLADNRDQNRATNILINTFEQQQSHAKQLNQQLRQFRTSKDPNDWPAIEQTKLSLDSLSQNKAKLLTYVSVNINEQFTGFGPDGVRQLLLEAQVTEAIINYQLISQFRHLVRFTTDLKVSPFPLLVLIFKLSLIGILLSWWLKTAPKLIVSQLKNTKRKPLSGEPISHVIWRYLNKVQAPLAWFTALSIMINTLMTLPGLDSINYLSVVINWSFAAAIIIRLLTEFTSHHSHYNNQSEIVELRVSTVKHWVWTLMAAGIILKATEMSVYQGTIYTWVKTLMLLVLLILLIKTLTNWRSVVFKQLSHSDEHPAYIDWAIKRQAVTLLAPIATLIGVYRLFSQRLFQELFNKLSKYQTFKHAIAYFFRVEVAKQSQADKQNANMVRIKGEETFSYVKPGHEDSELIENYASTELNEIARYVLAPTPAMALIYSERGLGLTTLLKRVIYRANSENAIYISCPYGGYQPLVQQINTALGLAKDADETELLQLLRGTEKRFVFCIDDCQRIISPKVGGLIDLMKLSKLLRRGRNQHGVLLGVEQSAWRFVDRARGERLLFDKVVAMPRWSETQIAALLSSRIDMDGEHALSFAGLKLPKQWDEHELTEKQRAEQGFYRILWDYSDGNPSVALRFFRQSLHQDKISGEVFVRIFKAPDAKELENMPKPMLAVLRAIVQLEVASAEELSACTQLGFAEVLNTLRYFQNRGFIELIDDKAKISSHWFRYITNTLHNQHLLVK
jgi:hypothetical protein